MPYLTKNNIIWPFHYLNLYARPILIVWQTLSAKQYSVSVSEGNVHTYSMYQGFFLISIISSVIVLESCSWSRRKELSCRIFFFFFLPSLILVKRLNVYRSFLYELFIQSCSPWRADQTFDSFNILFEPALCFRKIFVPFQYQPTTTKHMLCSMSQLFWQFLLLFTC